MQREKELMDDIAQYAENVRNEHENLLLTLAAIPAPSGQEEKRAAFVLEYLKAHGYDRAFTDEAGNVIVEIRGRDESLPVHIYTAHLDTVFPDTQPMPVSVTEDRISSPGVGDDTANVCALLLTLDYLFLHAVIPGQTTVFAFDTCEEGLGNLRGCRALMDRYAGRCGQFVSLDMGYDEGTDLAVGSRRWKISLQTEGGHSYWGFGKENAIARAAELIGLLYEVEAAGFPGTVTYNVGQIGGGTSVNTIAQNASFLYEYRSDHAYGLDAMDHTFRKILAAFSGPGFDPDKGWQDCARIKGLRICAEKIGDRPGMGEVDPAAMEALRKRVSDAVRRHTGREIRFASGSTDCNIPLSMGIPSICFGTYLGAGAHTRQEYVERASLAPGLAAELDFILSDMQN